MSPALRGFSTRLSHFSDNEALNVTEALALPSLHTPRFLSIFLSRGLTGLEQGRIPLCAPPQCPARSCRALGALPEPPEPVPPGWER